MQNLFPLVGSRVPGAECRLPSTGREIAIETGPVTEPVLRLVGAKAINCYLIFFRTQTCLSVRFGSVLIAALPSAIGMQLQVCNLEAALATVIGLQTVNARAVKICLSLYLNT